VRDLVATAWGAPVTDMYSSKEMGYIGLQCPDHPHYHVQSENVLLEVLDEAGQPCRPGEVGRVVLTSLNNLATPFVRYEIGDYAELGPACPCGRGLPVLRRILGRVRNMVTYPSGEKRWPYLGEEVYRAVAPVRQHQLVQKNKTEIEARFIVERPLSPSEEDVLRQVIQSKLGYPFRVCFTYHDRLSRGAGGKFEEFRSEINDQHSQAPMST